MTFAELERVCSNTSSLLIGAAMAAAGTDAVRPQDEIAALDHARLIARRTADGFSAALADRVHTVLAWPWDHVGTHVAWECSKNGTHARANEVLAEWSFGYVANQPEQAVQVANLWSQVTAGLDGGEPKHLDVLGGNALQLYLRERLKAAS